MKKVYEVRMENWEYRNRKNNLTTKQLADHACYCGGNCLGDTYNVIGRFNTLEEALKLFESSKDRCTTTWGLEHGLHTYTYDVLYIQSIPLNEDKDIDILIAPEQFALALTGLGYQDCIIDRQ